MDAPLPYVVLQFILMSAGRKRNMTWMLQSLTLNVYLYSCQLEGNTIDTFFANSVSAHLFCSIPEIYVCDIVCAWILIEFTFIINLVNIMM